MNRLQIIKTTGILFILFSILLNVPYYLLTQNFEYDDILRKPTGYVLTQFHAGGAGLILTWFAFAVMALLFIPASVLLQKVLGREDTPYLSAATIMGVLSGILQSVGLMRWVFVIPVLANLYVESASPATREAVVVVYQAVHQYGGVALGEQMGQFLLTFWTLGVGMAMLKSPVFKPWIGWLGLVTIPFWLIGQTELLATVIPSMPVWEVTPIGFMIWEVWLLVIGVHLLRFASKSNSRWVNNSKMPIIASE
ncbi:DUF4386 domain-containing protein [Halotia branconii]|uniref:DUF4386 domain-containing protein n=1 Tax=Halotia branconii CENA392 TaxID=1539056 RepID=A0AAJ6NQ74_9CYAN|nr:DUF4386 domain-containing protein [Halotia branconii]WGV24489.1 DUF4386 domain-containing protein [Halotia branconii CENA392]